MFATVVRGDFLSSTTSNYHRPTPVIPPDSPTIIMEHSTPRVNSALLPKYVGRTVRLTCKIIKLQGETAIVKAPDEGQVTVKLTMDSNISDDFVDIIGKVEDANTIKMYRSSNWGSNVDLDLVNKTIEEIHRLTDWFN